MQKLRVLLTCICGLLLSGQVRASDNAVVLVYHHVSELTPASTSISPARFRDHMEYLSANHNVLPLPQVINTLRAGKPLPDKTVAITFDDGFKNILKNGHPILREFGFPYTIFINPGQIGVLKNQLTWDQIAEMREQGVHFANHGFGHEHMLQRKTGESEKAWLTRTIAEVEKAERLLKEKTGESLKYIAYPYGEFNVTLKTALKDKGYVGFGQQSGAMASHSDFAALPRFAAAGIYANLSSLKTKLASLAMPVLTKSVANPELAFNNQGVQQMIKVDTSDLRLKQINCFLDGNPMSIDVGEDSININRAEKLNPGRTRINCTAPSIKHRGRFYWYSQPWFVPTKDGTWLE